MGIYRIKHHWIGKDRIELDWKGQDRIGFDRRDKSMDRIYMFS